MFYKADGGDAAADDRDCWDFLGFQQHQQKVLIHLSYFPDPPSDQLVNFLLDLCSVVLDSHHENFDSEVNMIFLISAYFQ